ncbi:hypothetical protein MLD38_007220 [Melastoma candidum]|uniref:Uncharacterized protein n=1 Tax=Melastoma candidum TaxID=119954 RepID=A0ACB9RYY1_9MYRT|nr:hypothetical protein MLD38_007220 [Melastoma candidum]
MGFCMAKAEALMRAISCSLLVLTACLVALDSQTKYIVFTYARKATYKDLNSLPVLVYIDAVAAAYNFFQLGKCTIQPCRCRNKLEPLPSSDQRFLYLPWLCFLLDQVAVYIVFGATVGAMQGSMLAVTGSKVLQWMKLCNRYKRFCMQIGGALLCGYVASIAMVVLSFISAYNLFRLYSPTKIMQLKSK